MTKYEENTDEAKDANQKKIKVDGEEKWLLMDDDETEASAELKEMIKDLVAEALQGMFKE